MSKWKRTGTVFLVFLFCAGMGVIAVGLVQTLQNQKVQHLYVSPKAVADYKTAIDTEKKNMEQLDLLIADAEKKLSEYQSLSERIQNSDMEEKMLSELEYCKMAAGASDVEGEGVIVILDDASGDVPSGYDPNSELIHDRDLLTLVNELNAAGAEAISVKGQRIGNRSSMSCAGYTVQINGQKFARPFEIQAIGDSKRMAAALIGPGGYGTLLRDQYHLRCDVQVKENIRISAFPDDQTFLYMTKTKEGETN